MPGKVFNDVAGGDCEKAQAHIPLLDQEGKWGGKLIIFSALKDEIGGYSPIQILTIYTWAITSVKLKADVKEFIKDEIIRRMETGCSIPLSPAVREGIDISL